MNEKLTKSKEKKQVVKKKAYTTPLLTIYGKLADLTKGGTRAKGEGTPGSTPTSKP